MTSRAKGADGGVRPILMEVIGRLVRTFDLRRPSWVRPLPRVRVDSGRWIPAWALHLSSAAVALGCTALVATHRAQWVLALFLIAMMLGRPAGVSPAILAVGIGLHWAVSGGSDLTPALAATVLGIHLLAVLTTTGGTLNRTTRVELAVLTEPLRRFLVLQSLVQPLLWLAISLTARGVAVTWLPIVAAISLAILAWGFLALLMFRRQR